MTSQAATAATPFTGRKMLFSVLAFFGVIIAANMTMMTFALTTHTGTVVPNSYVASQEFDERRSAQQALGWTVQADAVGGLVILAITSEFGNPVEVAELDAIVGRATHVKDDIIPDFKFDGTAYVAPAELGEGNWNIRMKAKAFDGTEFVQRVVLHVKR